MTCFDATAIRHADWAALQGTIGRKREKLAGEERDPRKAERALKKWKSQMGAELIGALGIEGPALTREAGKLRSLYGILGEKEVAESVGQAWRKRNPQPPSPVADPAPQLDLLPEGSWLLEVGFQLTSDLLCKDDAAVYAIDNPVKKDRVRGFPEYWGPSWKGILRHAYLTYYGEETEKGWRLEGEARAQDVRLFGSTKRERKAFRAGRLRFFTTRFARTGFAIIHPSSRTPRKGTPILYETVPGCTPGIFRLLYCPFDGAAAGDLARQVEEDAAAAGHSVRRMFELGLGAKSSAGFGEACVERVSLTVRGGFEELAGRVRALVTPA